MEKLDGLVSTFLLACLMTMLAMTSLENISMLISKYKLNIQLDCDETYTLLAMQIILSNVILHLLYIPVINL